jgi:hypothetical protein
MDRNTVKTKREAFVAIAIAIGIFVLIGVGLVIMGMKSIDVTSTKTLRSEMARKLRERETMDCTATWTPEDAYEFVDAGEISNPEQISVTFAMQDGGEKFYLDRYFDGEKYLSFYADGDSYYVWSAKEYLWRKGQLYHSELMSPVAPYAKMTEEEFNKQYPDFFDTVDTIIREFPAGTDIRCDIGGTMGYSAPKDAPWHTQAEIEEVLKQRKEEDE